MPQNPSTVEIVCVGVDAPSVARIAKSVADEAAVVALEYGSPGLSSRVASAATVFVRWDCVGGLADQLVRSIPKELGLEVNAHREIVAFFTDPSDLPGPELKDQIPIDRWVRLPHEFFKVYQVLKAMMDNVRQSNADVATSAIDEYEIPTVDDAAAVEEILETTEHLKVERDNLVVEVQTRALDRRHNPEFWKRIGVFHPNQAVLHGMERQLRHCGYADVRGFTEVSQVFEPLRADGLDLIIAIYQPGEYRVIQLFRELNEARELERFSTLILCPGKNAITELAQSQDEFFYDRVAVSSAQKDEFIEIVSSAFTSSEDPESPNNVLYQLRRPWRFGADDHDRTPIPPPLMEAIVGRIEKSKGIGYWARAERILHLVLSKNMDRAAVEADGLKAEYPDSFDAEVIRHISRVHGQDRSKVGESLVEAIVTHRDLNLEKCYRLGKLFLLWQTPAPLARLLNYWIPREDLGRDHQLHYFIGSYYGLIKNHAKQGRFLLSACLAQPLRGEYLVALAEYLNASGQRDQAQKIWQLALKAPRTDRAKIEQILAS